MSNDNYEKASNLVSRYVLWNVNELIEELQRGSQSDALIDKFCKYDLDPEPVEIFEFWLVDPWFGRQLSERGEVVEDVFGLCVWGRTCTGQAIALDYVINQIANAP